MTGPSSRMMLSATTLPSTYKGTELVNWYPPCCDVTSPERIPVTQTRGMLSDAHGVGLGHHLPE